MPFSNHAISQRAVFPFDVHLFDICKHALHACGAISLARCLMSRPEWDLPTCVFDNLRCGCGGLFTHKRLNRRPTHFLPTGHYLHIRLLHISHLKKLSKDNACPCSPSPSPICRQRLQYAIRLSSFHLSQTVIANNAICLLKAFQLTPFFILFSSTTTC